MKYYKVIRNVSFSDKPTYKSCGGNFCDVVYEIGTWTLPHPELKNSKLFVFDTFDNAKQFIHRMWGDGFSIFECSVKGKPIAVKFIGGCHAIRQYWIARQRKKKYIPASQYYPGTLIVDAVKLLKKVYG